MTIIPQIIWRGFENYQNSFNAMRIYTMNRTFNTPDQFWIVEHPAVFTLGLGANPVHILNPHTIPVIQSDRGGEVTFHGPGQAIVYLLIDLRRYRSYVSLLIREFVQKIEQAVIDTLALYNIFGERKKGAAGIYINKAGTLQGAKIAALGLKICSNGCTYHGVSLNVKMDLIPFSWINPCGYKGLSIVDMQTLGVNVVFSDVQCLLAENLAAYFTLSP